MDGASTATVSLRCQFCGRDFARGEHLRRHVRTHTKEKPFLCPCGRSFARRDLLTRHERLTSHSAQRGVEARQLHQASPVPSGNACDAMVGVPIMPHDDTSTVYNFQGSFQDMADFWGTTGLDFDMESGTLPYDGQVEGIPTSQSQPVQAEPGLSTRSLPIPQSMPSTGISTGLHDPRSIPDTAEGDDDFQELKPVSHPWKISEDQRNVIGQSVRIYHLQLGNFALPSRLSIARYVSGFVEGFSHHHPFIHLPTFCLTLYPRNPELTLAILALGAQFRYETAKSFDLYNAAKTIVLHRLHTGGLYHTGLASSSPQIHLEYMHTVRAVLILATFSSWQRSTSFMQDLLIYQPVLARLVRDSGLAETASNDGDSWPQWTRVEGDRRTKLSAFCLLNLQSIVYNVTPVLMSHEIALRLPSSCKVWLAKDSAAWTKTRTDELELVNFQSAYVAVLDAKAESIPITSPFGNFIMIHALLQRFILLWHLALPLVGGLPSFSEAFELDNTLQRWKAMWHKAPESILDIRDPNGSLSWSATSLLGLAHIRVHFDLGKHRQLARGDPVSVAEAAHAAPLPTRGPHLLQALLHSAHALNVPVQLGVSFLSRCQAFFWSLQHSICGFEAAIFLSKWLTALATTQPIERLDRNERQVLKWIWSITVEAEGAMSHELQGTEIPSDFLSANVVHPNHLKRLNIRVVKVFAHIFEHSNSVWPLIALIGQSLSEYAILQTGCDYDSQRDSRRGSTDVRYHDM